MHCTGSGTSAKIRRAVRAQSSFVWQRTTLNSQAHTFAEQRLFSLMSCDQLFLVILIFGVQGVGLKMRGAAT